MVYFREDQDSLTAKNLMEKAEADFEKDKKSELLTKQQGVYRNVLCHSLKMRPD